MPDVRMAMSAVAAAGAVTTSPYDTAVADWRASDYNGVATTWTDRIGGLTFALNGTAPPTWNSFLKAFDFNGTTQYLEIADNALFDFAVGQDFTVNVVWEPLATGQVSKVLLAKRSAFTATSIGWALRLNATGKFEATCSDGTSQVASNTLDGPTVAASTGFWRGGTSGRSFIEATEGNSVSFASLGTLENTLPMRLCANSAPTPGNFLAARIFRVTIWRLKV